MRIGCTGFVLPLLCMAADQPDRRAERAGELARLGRELRHESNADVERLKPELRDQLTNKVRSIVIEHIVDELASRGPRQLRESLLAIPATPQWPAEHSGTPYVFTAGDVVIAVYSFDREGSGSPNRKNLFLAFRRDARGYRFVDGTGDDFDGYGLFVSEVESPRPGETWLFVHGIQSGNSKRSRIRMYRFDGERFDTVWSPNDRPQGSCKITGRHIIIRSLDEERYYRTHVPPYEREEKFRITDAGVIEVYSLLGNYPPFTP